MSTSFSARLHKLLRHLSQPTVKNEAAKIKGLEIYSHGFVPQIMDTFIFMYRIGKN